eukprot:Amastigsp_a174663_523.p4 type:complete len:119 gc:universal Amastigsp_a174663_523:1362-1006(-)
MCSPGSLSDMLMSMGTVGGAASASASSSKCDESVFALSRGTYTGLTRLASTSSQLSSLKNGCSLTSAASRAEPPSRSLGLRARSRTRKFRASASSSSGGIDSWPLRMRRYMRTLSSAS